MNKNFFKLFLIILIAFVLLPSTTSAQSAAELQSQQDAMRGFAEAQAADATGESQLKTESTQLSNSATQAANPYVEQGNGLPANYTSAMGNCVGPVLIKYIENLMGISVQGLVGKATTAVTGAISGILGGGGVSGAVSGATGGKVNIGSQVPTDPQTIKTQVDDIKSKTSAQESSGNLLTPLAICVANKLVQQMTSATVQWINNGFQNPDGTTGPAFVSNPKQFFLGIADREAGGFFQGLGPVGSLLCKPFDIKVRLAILNEYRGSYAQQAQCSLSSIKNNLQNFGKGSSGKGGNYWNDWFELTQKDQNNAMGSYFLAREEMAKSIQYNQDVNRLEVTIGRGFLDMKKCVKYKADGKTCQDWTVTTPGTEIQANLDRVLTTEAGRINIANSFDDIVEALITQLLKRAMTGMQGN